jgi:hypothetical protein
MDVKLAVSRSLLSSLFMGLFLVACAPSTPSSTQGAPVTAYTSPSPSPYPYSNSSAYPGDSSPTRDPNVKPFRLNKPVIEGATIVTGTGPAAVPILLQDVTFAGAPLGETVIGMDGTFTFQVAPLGARHRIGVTLGNLETTNFSSESFTNPSYQGDEAMLLPQISFYYDTTLVKGTP